MLTTQNVCIRTFCVHCITDHRQPHVAVCITCHLCYGLQWTKLSVATMQLVNDIYHAPEPSVLQLEDVEVLQLLLQALLLLPQPQVLITQQPRWHILLYTYELCFTVHIFRYLLSVHQEVSLLISFYSCATQRSETWIPKDSAEGIIQEDCQRQKSRSRGDLLFRGF